MAVFTKIDKSDINKIENSFNLGIVKKYNGIKKGIENTNYFLEFNKKKTILTIFEKRLSKRDLPFFMVFQNSKLYVLIQLKIKKDLIYLK